MELAEFVKEVKAGTDIVTVIAERVRLRPQGGNRHKGLCPFHSEKTPSFNVHGGEQFFKCFGCSKGGDVFTFLMEIDGLSFIESVRTLAEKQGLSMPSTSRGADADAAARRREVLLLLQERAQTFFARQLRGPKGNKALRYVRGRGLADDVIAKFGLGYAPPGNVFQNGLRKGGFKRGEVLDSGLVGKSAKDGSTYDRFRDRLMFPIHTDAGKLIGFGGRILAADKQPKYLNSPETPIYRKHSVLYNLHRARAAMRQEGMVVLVEGYMDVIGVASAGIENVVAACGTALTPQQVSLIRRHCETVIVNFDADPSGQAAAERSVELLLREGMSVRVLELGGGMDPDEFCRAHGAERYRRELSSAPSYFAWLLSRTRKLLDFATAEGRTRAFDRILKAVLLLPSDLQRAATVTELAEHLGLPHSVALSRLRGRTNPERSSGGPRPPPEDGMLMSERILVTLLATDATARQELLDESLRLTANGLASNAILQAIRAVEAESEQYDALEVYARLDEENRERLARLSFDGDRPPPNLGEGRAALEGLRQTLFKHQYRELGREIVKAERRGESAAVDALIKQRNGLAGQLGVAERQS